MSKPHAYQLVADELRRRLQAGAYSPGARMPSLRTIENEFSVSRATSQAAYRSLVDEGLVVAKFGGGYYVRSYNPIIRHGIERLAHGPRAAGRSVWDVDPGTTGRRLDVTDIHVSTETTPPSLAPDLGATTVARRRRYILDGKPVLLSASYFPADLAQGTQLEHTDTGPGGAYSRLTDLGHPPLWFQEDITARMPTASERSRLALPPGTPVLIIRRSVWAPSGRVVEVNEMTADAGSYILRYRWAAQAPPEPPDA